MNQAVKMDDLTTCDQLQMQMQDRRSKKTTLGKAAGQVGPTGASAGKSSLKSSSGDINSDEESLMYKLKNKRGKKAQDLDDYKQYVQEKIDELDRLIKDPSTALQDRKKYRNQKTSYSARLRNRSHTSQITSQLGKKDNEVKQLMKIVKACVTKDTLTPIGQMVNSELPDLARRLTSIFPRDDFAQPKKRQRTK